MLDAKGVRGLDNGNSSREFTYVYAPSYVWGVVTVVLEGGSSHEMLTCWDGVCLDTCNDSSKALRWRYPRGM